MIIADKSNALNFEEGERALEFSLTSLGTEYIDLMLLHNVPLKSVFRQDTMGRSYESGNLEKRMGALKAWLDAKDSGLIRSVGLSTHSTGVLKQALLVPEIEIVCTTLNQRGMFVEGNLNEHIAAIRELHDAGKGIYVIKLLQAGRITVGIDEALRWAFGFHDFIDAWNLGMYDVNEVIRNMELLDEVLA